MASNVVIQVSLAPSVMDSDSVKNENNQMKYMNMDLLTPSSAASSVRPTNKLIMTLPTTNHLSKEEDENQDDDEETDRKIDLKYIAQVLIALIILGFTIYAIFEETFGRH